MCALCGRGVYCFWYMILTSVSVQTKSIWAKKEHPLGLFDILHSHVCLTPAIEESVPILEDSQLYFPILLVWLRVG